MTKTNICTILCLLLPAMINIARSQTVSNVTAAQRGDNIVVSYYIDKSAANVQLTVSTDGGETFSQPLKEVSGDVGKVTAGRHEIVWDVCKEYGSLVGNNIVFNVLTGSKQAGSPSAKVASDAKQPKTSAGQPKKAKFQFGLGASAGYQFVKQERRDLSYNGMTGFEFGADIYMGVQFVGKYHIGAFFSTEAHEDAGNRMYLGLDLRYCFLSSKLYCGAKVGYDLKNTYYSRTLVQAQFGYSPWKWLTLNIRAGYPSIQAGLTFNIPN